MNSEMNADEALLVRPCPSLRKGDPLGTSRAIPGRAGAHRSPCLLSPASICRDRAVDRGLQTRPCSGPNAGAGRGGMNRGEIAGKSPGPPPRGPFGGEGRAQPLGFPDVRTATLRAPLLEG